MVEEGKSADAGGAVSGGGPGSSTRRDEDPAVARYRRRTAEAVRKVIEDAQRAEARREQQYAAAKTAAQRKRLDDRFGAERKLERDRINAFVQEQQSVIEHLEDGSLLPGSRRRKAARLRASQGGDDESKRPDRLEGMSSTSRMEFIGEMNEKLENPNARRSLKRSKHSGRTSTAVAMLTQSQKPKPRRPLRQDHHTEQRAADARKVHLLQEQKHLLHRLQSVLEKEERYYKMVAGDHGGGGSSRSSSMFSTARSGPLSARSNRSDFSVCSSASTHSTRSTSSTASYATFVSESERGRVPLGHTATPNNVPRLALS